jgi:hypothetical protein
MTAMYWIAKAAPLDVEAADGRLLDAAGTWTLPRPAPLIHEGQPVGRVTHVAAVDQVLVAAGLVNDSDVAERMDRRELRPQIEFGDDAVVEVIGETLRFTSGRIAAIVAGTAPAFADVWFKLFTQHRPPSTQSDGDVVTDR